MAEEILLAQGENLGMQTMVEPDFNESVCHSMNTTQLEELDFLEDCRFHFAGQDLPPSLLTIIQIFYALVCISGLCGNTLVIYVVLRFSKMQTVTNIYILMLALADECFLVGIPFLIVTSVHGDWIFGTTMCKIYFTTTSINQFTSSIFLTVMSADRYIAVCHPISSPRFRTPVIARSVSLTAWAASALMMVPVFMYAATITKQDTGGESCNIFWPFEEDTVPSGPHLNSTLDSKKTPQRVINGQTAFTFYSFILSFAIPLILILIFYVLVIIKLKTVGPKNKSKEKKKSHRKVTRLVLTVITVYILCWLPYWITQLALIFTPPGRNQDKVMVAIMLLAGCLSYSNSAMNPVLYAFLSENFKKSFLKACRCAGGREFNAALQVENSAFPRRGTLAGMKASAKEAKNAAISRFQSARESRGTKSRDQKSKANGTSHNGVLELEQHEMNDISTGVSKARSCFNSSACPTGNTSVTVPSACGSATEHDQAEEMCLLHKSSENIENHGNDSPLPVVSRTTAAAESQTMTTTVATVNGPHVV